jgi:hypothetical protein
MKKYDPQAVPVKAEPLPYQEVEGEIFAITPDDGVLHNFNEVGSFIWTLIDGENSLEKIEGGVLAEYEVVQDDLRRDMADFFAALVQKGLIEYRR